MTDGARDLAVSPALGVRADVDDHRAIALRGQRVLGTDAPEVAARVLNQLVDGEPGLAHTGMISSVTTGLAEHWDAAYAGGEQNTSWFETGARVSLAILDELGIEPHASVVDVGGGASRLVDALIGRGHSEVAVVDLSPVALDVARGRLGAAAAGVRWVTADVTTWRPDRTYDVWHDRAVLHFLVDPADQAAYRDTLDAVLAPRGCAVLGTFASDGPERCSGLPVARRDPAALEAFLGPGFEPVTSRRAVHTTPGGAQQRFAWVGVRRSEA